jgi:hypothetical protein
MADPAPININNLLAQFQGNLTAEQLKALRSQIEASYAIDYSKTIDYSTGAAVVKYADQRAEAIAANEDIIKKINDNNNILRSIASASFAPDPQPPTIVPVIIDGISALQDNVTKTIYLSKTSGSAPKETAALTIKTNNEKLAEIQKFNAALVAAPRAQADGLLLDLQKLALQKGMQAEDRAAAANEAAANRIAAVTAAQKATVQTIITTKFDPIQGKDVWVVRQILKDGTTQDTPYTATSADIAKTLFTTTDGWIGTLGEGGIVSNWTYKPPRISSEGENKYTIEWDAANQIYDDTKRVQIAKAGQKLEFWNGKVYRTYTDDKGKYTVEEVAGIPNMSQAEADRLNIETRNVEISEARQKSDALKDAASTRLIQQQIDATTAAQSTATDIIAGKATAALGLIKSGTAADLAKAQELYQSARKDWEVEKKNATDRRDKAQDKGLRRSGMMFLRGATAVQGGKTGADAQKMWKEEYNRTPGKEGETYTERMARSQGLGADLDQNLDTTFPTMADWLKGATANPNASANPQSVATKTVAPASTVPPVPIVPPAFNPNISPKTAQAITPSGTITGTVNAAGYQTDTFPTVSPNGAGPGNVPAQSLNQGQVAVAPSSMPPQGYQTGMNADGSNAPMQVPVVVAPDAPLPASWKQYTPENYQNIQGSTQQGDANVGDVNVDGEDPMTKLTRIHAQLNGFSAE